MRMDLLQFISTMTGHLAWPLAAVLLGFMFREQVRKLLDKMKSLKAPGIEASFAEQAQVIAIEAKRVELAPPAAENKLVSSTTKQTRIGGDPARTDLYRRKLESFARNPE